MPERVSTRIEDDFAPLADLRRRPVICPLIDMATITICAVFDGESEPRSQSSTQYQADA